MCCRESVQLHWSGSPSDFPRCDAFQDTHIRPANRGKEREEEGGGVVGEGRVGKGLGVKVKLILTLKSCMHIRSARLTQHIHTLLNVVRYNIHSCTIDVIVHTCRCPQQIPSTRDYHPGHQQSDLSQGGEEVEVNPTSTTPNHQHLHVLCVGVSV